MNNAIFATKMLRNQSANDVGSDLPTRSAPVHI